MTSEVYTTKQIADAVGIHVNTVRFYEKTGFLTKPERRLNGYRVYTRLHLEQCRLVRLAMRAEVLQNGLREKAVELIRLCAALDMEGATTAAKQYALMIDRELANAVAAAASVEGMLKKRHSKSETTLKRRDAALSLGVTTETLRTWERSGLIETRRARNGYRLYTEADMERLNIIRTLRLANYSLSAILRLLNSIDGNGAGRVEDVLNTPNAEEDVLSVCDRLMVSLESTSKDAEEVLQMLEKIKLLI